MLRVPTYNVLPIVVLRVPAYNVLHIVIHTPNRRAACTSLQCTPNSKDKMAVLRVPTYNVLPIIVLRVPAYNVLPTKGTYRTQVHQLQ